MLRAVFECLGGVLLAGFFFWGILEFAEHASASQDKAKSEAEMCIVYKYEKDATKFLNGDCWRYTNWKGVQ